MPYVHYRHTRSRSRSNERTPIHTSNHTPTHIARPLVRHSSKHNLSSDSDDGYDDYPYAPNHKPSKPSRALTLRNEPSQLERYNIWSDRSKPADERHENDYQASLHHHHDRIRDIDDVDDEEERAFRLKVQASFSHTRPPSPPRTAHAWPGALFRRREKYVDEAFEARERTKSPPRRRVSFWDDKKVDVGKEEDDEEEKWFRYRRVKRTRTQEWRPLSGWRRG
ncbi:hypothetical protein P153DRAFT_383162 [Dothidotthia symphoricarpi CBS 119687]|uniref:Uncharacterized protein n=1 Tax=Dothidotthia symphoricarpi CBS 119687 TaxID=1392245 RepID=A0A6A6AM81_9PLEO|nr:uncharacterized protein P153DRAFT_383162 [Dothidotthia symphoricarpi CBS 119687]KAF2132273.1 hypothetical protein P153DRAFT_383162 [Dothidotthia symphoricarpi CBS 119687]